MQCADVNGQSHNGTCFVDNFSLLIGHLSCSSHKERGSIIHRSP